jgi:hypothetical protein
MSVHPLLLFFTLATSIDDVISAHGYDDIVTFILKRMPRSHLVFSLAVNDLEWSNVSRF